MLVTLSHLAVFLRGKKTYLVSAAALIYGAGIVQGLWPHQPGIDFLLSGTGLASVRAAIAKLESPGTSTAAAATDGGAL